MEKHLSICEGGHDRFNCVICRANRTEKAIGVALCDNVKKFLTFYDIFSLEN